ncbi:MAG: hypothetical protein AAB665_02990 [Patescibacteria group bacterium]
MKKILRVATLSIVLFPALAYAAPKNFSELAKLMVDLIEGATVVMMVFGLVMYLWGMAVNIPEFGDEKGAEKRKSFFFWGIIVLFLMVSIWGILRLLETTLFGDISAKPAPSERSVFE